MKQQIDCQILLQEMVKTAKRAVADSQRKNDLDRFTPSAISSEEFDVDALLSVQIKQSV
jgi:hypothetical protein